jgi:cytoskeletal protein CcmA (bactofilin family)|tara:strand:- start:538 stop:1380 length:843 start_codon:yes stop_codon:yes gene_type:complete
MPDYESYRGKAIALTFTSVFKTGDNKELPFNTSNRDEPAVFSQGALRSVEPNALATITDGGGVPSSLAIGQQHAGVKIFGPTHICNIGTPLGEPGTGCTYLCVDGGKAVFTNNISVGGNADVTGDITVNDITASGCIIGANICSTATICADTTIQATGNITSGSTIQGVNLCATGTIQSNGDIIAFASSDKNLKSNIKKIQNSNNILKGINGYTFDWNEEAERSGSDYGVIAQEIQEVVPEIVVERSNGTLAVDYQKLIPILIEEVKSLNNRIEVLEGKK